jgi:hypothetical protein
MAAAAAALDRKKHRAMLEIRTDTMLRAILCPRTPVSVQGARNLTNVSAITRWLPASGLLAAVAFALTGLISQPPPVAGAAAADIISYYAGHHAGLELESMADCIGATLLVVFAATFHSRTRTMASLTAFAAAAIVSACVLVQVAAFQALAFRPGPDATRAALLNDLQSFTFQVATFPTLSFLGAAAATILTSRSLPRWLGLAAIAAAVLQAVSWISFFAPSGMLAAGGLPDVVSFAALLAWLVACSVVMLARRVRVESPAP